MAAPIRVLIPRANAHMQSVAAYCQTLQKDGKTPILVTANRPYATMKQRMAEAGVDDDNFWWLDAVSSVNGHQPADRPQNVLFLQSPTMLEMIAMRTEQLVGRTDNPHVVVDCLNALSLYNGPGPVQEFSHYLANRLRARDTPGDFLVLANEEGAALEAAVAGFVEPRHVIA